jgi:hypothetical protein
MTTRSNHHGWNSASDGSTEEVKEYDGHTRKEETEGGKRENILHGCVNFRSHSTSSLKTLGPDLELGLLKGTSWNHHHRSHGMTDRTHLLRVCVDHFGLRVRWWPIIHSVDIGQDDQKLSIDATSNNRSQRIII